MLRKVILFLVIAVLTCVPFAVDKAEAIDACDLAYVAPEGLRGAMSALCWVILLERPDFEENPWAL